MAGARMKDGTPLDSTAWGEDHQAAVAKWSALASDPRASKDDIAKAAKARDDTMDGFQKAVEQEKKKKGGQQPVNTGAAASIFGSLFGQ